MFNTPGKQSIVRIIISVAGALIGTLSTLYIYPLDMELHGLSMFLLTASLMFAPFILLGSSAVAINNYPEFKTEDKRDNGFLSFIILIYLIGSFLFALAFIFGEDWFSQYFMSHNGKYDKYFQYILPLTILQAGCTLIDVYLNNFTKVIIPALLKEFLLKLTLPLLIGLHILGYITVDMVIWGLLANYIIALLLLILYTIYLRKQSFHLTFRFLTRSRLEKIANYSLFAILGVFGNQMVVYIDTIMIKAILPDFSYISIYNMHSSMANFINMPVIAIISVASPFVAKYIAGKEDGRLVNLYISSSTIMLLLGSFLFTGIVINMDAVYLLMSNGDAYRSGFWVVVFLGIAKLVDMATGLNSQIIGYSKYYKFNFYALIILGLSNAILNYFLIHKTGVSGAALATLISLTLFNMAKLLYVKKKFGIWPFTIQDLYIVILAGICGCIAFIMPSGENPYFQIAIRTIVFSILFWPTIVYFNFSPKVTEIYQQVWKKIKDLLLK